MTESTCECTELLAIRNGTQNGTCVACECPDSRFFPPACTTNSSELIHYADAMVFSIFFVLAVICGVFTAMELVVFIRTKRKQSRIFRGVVLSMTLLSVVAMDLYYLTRILGAYSTETPFGAIPRRIIAVVMGALVLFTAVVISITWLEIMTSAQALTKNSIRVHKLVLWLVLGVGGAINGTSAIAIPLLSPRTTEHGIVQAINVISIIIMVVVMLAVMIPKTIAAHRWLSEQIRDDPVHTVRVAMAKTRAVIVMLTAFLLLIVLAALRLAVSSMTVMGLYVYLVIDVANLCMQLAIVACTILIAGRKIILLFHSSAQPSLSITVSSNDHRERGTAESHTGSTPTSATLSMQKDPISTQTDHLDTS